MYSNQGRTFSGYLVPIPINNKLGGIKLKFHIMAYDGTETYTIMNIIQKKYKKPYKYEYKDKDITNGIVSDVDWRIGNLSIELSTRDGFNIDLVYRDMDIISAEQNRIYKKQKENEKRTIDNL